MITHPRLLLAARAQLAYILTVILFGAFVRLSRSGAGCGRDWPLCRGELIPRQAPWTTLVEYTHRLSSGLTLAVALTLFAFLAHAAHRHPSLATARRAQLLTLALLGLEAAIGAAIVLAEHVAASTANARVLSAALHLISTFLLTRTALTVCLALATPAAAAPGHHRSVTLATTALLAVGLSGAIAAVGDTVFPPTSTADVLALALDPASHLFMRLRVAHPLLAVALSFVALTSVQDAVRCRACTPDGARRFYLLIATQWLCGSAQIVWLAPAFLQLLHLALAQGAWLSLHSGVFHAHALHGSETKPRPARTPTKATHLQATDTPGPC